MPVLNIVTDPQGLHDLYPEWQELSEQSLRPNIFLTWEWISTWYSHFSHLCALRIVVLREANTGRLLGLAPLAIYSKRLVGVIPLRELGFASQNLAPDHMDFLIRQGHEQVVIKAFFDWIDRKDEAWDVLLLSGVSDRSPILSHLAEETRGSWYHRHQIICPYLTLPDDVSAWFSSLPKKRRYKIRNCERALQAAYPGKTQIHCIESESEVEAGLSALIRLHRDTRKARRTANAFADQRAVECHRAISALFLKKNWLRLYVLRVGNEPIAATYCFHYRKTFSFYATGYDTRFARFSPGMTLLAGTIEKAISEGATYFDFLRGDETYKRVFARGDTRDFQIRQPTSLIGKLMTRFYDIGRERIRPGLQSIAAIRR